MFQERFGSYLPDSTPSLRSLRAKIALQLFPSALTASAEGWTPMQGKRRFKRRQLFDVCRLPKIGDAKKSDYRSNND